MNDNANTIHVLTAEALALAAGKDPKTDSMSGYCDIVEDLALGMGLDGIEDSSWSWEAQDDARDYVRKEFDFDREVAKLDDKAFIGLVAALGVEMPTRSDSLQAPKIALQYPDVWAGLMAAIEEADESTLRDYIPAFDKAIEDAIEETEKETRREYLRGDRSNDGLERMIEKRYNLESFEVKDYQTAQFVIGEDNLEDWEERLREYQELEEDEEVDFELAAKMFAGELAYEVRTVLRKRKEEAEKSKLEREERKAREAAYEERKANEREEFLRSLCK